MFLNQQPPIFAVIYPTPPGQGLSTFLLQKSFAVDTKEDTIFKIDR